MLEMSLISCKIVLKCKWNRQFVLVAAGVDHVNVNDDNISFTNKDTELYLLVVTLYQQKTIKNYRNFLAMGLKDQFIEVNIKQKIKIKIQQMSVDVFSNLNLHELIHRLC